MEAKRNSLVAGERIGSGGVEARRHSAFLPLVGFCRATASSFLAPTPCPPAD